MEKQNAEAERLYLALRETEEKLQLETESLTHKHGIEISQAESEVCHRIIVLHTPGTNIVFLQIAKLKDENSHLQAKMLAAVQDASKNSQAKDTHIHQLEKKVWQSVC